MIIALNEKLSLEVVTWNFTVQHGSEVRIELVRMFDYLRVIFRCFFESLERKQIFKVLRSKSRSLIFLRAFSESLTLSWQMWNQSISKSILRKSISKSLLRKLSPKIWKSKMFLNSTNSPLNFHNIFLLLFYRRYRNLHVFVWKCCRPCQPCCYGYEHSTIRNECVPT